MNQTFTKPSRGRVESTPDFTDPLARTPIVVPAMSRITRDTAEEILQRYQRTGFALLAYDQDVAETTVSRLARRLRLGAAFLPPLYRTGEVQPAVITRISTAAEVAHPSFSRSGGQALHTDGTLQAIGEVRTVILACRRPALSGGESTLFNATGAFVALGRQDPEAAAALTTDCLLRRATVNDSAQQTLGPAFAVRENEVVTRYSVGDTDAWVEPAGTDPVAWRRGIAFLRQQATAGSPYYLEFRLAANTVLLLANARLAHGRRPFVDSPERPRCLYRGLYLHHPATAELPR